jgi:hypothetical protein
MITVCTRWESVQMPADLEWRMWTQLAGAFGVDRFAAAPIVLGPTSRLNQYETFEEALESCQGQRVFLEPTGEKTISEIPDGDVVFILGNTQHSNKHLTKSGETYRIATPRQTDLYGINAAAIALAYYHGMGT